MKKLKSNWLIIAIGLLVIGGFVFAIYEGVIG